MENLRSRSRRSRRFLRCPALAHRALPVATHPAGGTARTCAAPWTSGAVSCAPLLPPTGVSSRKCQNKASLLPALSAPKPRRGARHCGRTLLFTQRLLRLARGGRRGRPEPMPSGREQISMRAASQRVSAGGSAESAGKPAAPNATEVGPAFPKEPPRKRSKVHLHFVQRQPCLVCKQVPSDPHHLKFAQPRALGRKVSDEFTVPLCRTHHQELHAP